MNSTRDLLAMATAKTWRPDQPISRLVGVMRSGVLAVERRIADGRRVLCVLFKQGDLIDLRRSERLPQGQLLALTPATFLAFDETRFDAYLSTCSDTATIVQDQLREHTARMRDHAVDLACKTPTERTASVLFEFKRWPPVYEDDSFRLPIRRRDISDYIGVRAETLSRCMRSLESERLISFLSPRQVRLTDIPTLRRIANGGRPRRSKPVQ
ncbi:MAG: Crp/Fnr family transcriptional regulator [Alphaproteobacteria bacterium]